MIASSVAVQPKPRHLSLVFGADAPQLTPALGPTAEPYKILWSYGRPQTTDTIVHPGGQKTQVTSLIDGGQIFNQIDTILDKATDSVLVDLYEIQHPELHSNRSCPPGTPGADKQAQILKKLVALHQKGVKVKVILDNSYDARAKNQHNEKTISFLKQNGVEVLAYPTNGAKISHVKLIVVDGKYAVMGGMNWGNHSPVNHDACVFLEGDDVANVAEQIFKVDYQYAGGDVSTLPKFNTFPEGDIKVHTTSGAGSPDGGKDEIVNAILHRIETAQKSILCELFVLTDKDVAQKLIEAHQRLTAAGQPGVKILVDPGLYFRFKNCRPVVDYLAKQGVPIKFYKSDWAKEEKLHAKWAVFDHEIVTIGSANWSKMGLKPKLKKDAKEKGTGYKSEMQFMNSNHEANLEIKSKAIAAAFIKQFKYDWLHKSLPMKGASFIFKTIPKEVRDKMFAKSTPTPVQETVGGSLSVPAPVQAVPHAPAAPAQAPSVVTPLPVPGPTKIPGDGFVA